MGMYLEILKTYNKENRIKWLDFYPL